MELPYYVQVLEEELNKRKQKNSRYSLRAFSGFLELHPSALSRILTGKQELSVPAALSILPKLALDPDKQERFIVSVAQEKFMHAINTMSKHEIEEDHLRKVDALKQTQRLLEESELRFSTIANMVPDLLWYSRADGFNVWYNKRWADYTGQSAEESRGFGWLAVTHPDDRDITLDKIRIAVKEKTPFVHERRLCSAEGEYRWFLCRAELTLDQNGDVARLYGAATDIHDLRNDYEILKARVGEKQIII